MTSTITDVDLKNTELQADYELKYLPQQVVYTFLAAAINAMVKGASLIWLPLLFAPYNTGGIINPITVLCIVYINYVFDTMWMKWCGHADLPSVSMLIEELCFVWYRVPYTGSWSALTLRVKISVIKWVLSITTVCAYMTGVYIVTLREGTLSDTNTSQDNVGQPKWDNTLLSHGTMMFVVALIGFVKSFTNHRVYLGAEIPKRLWPSFDVDKFIKLSPYKAAVDAAIAVFTIPLTGGWISFEWVFATAAVSRKSSDTDLFTGLLIVGTALSLLVSWFMFTWPSLTSWLTNLRADLMAMKNERPNVKQGR